MVATHDRSRPVITGAISAATGDRKDAVKQILDGSIKVDVLIGGYLAEINLAWRKAEMDASPEVGYDPTFIQCLQVASKEPKQRLDEGNFPKSVVNAGGLNPRGMATKVKAFLEEEFDPEIQRKTYNLDESITLDQWSRKDELVIANAYIGQWGLVKALQEGADIVIGGVTTDASPTQAAASWWHGWDEKDFDKLAMGLIAGHLIECGQYATGGNYCGFRNTKTNNWHLAMPIAEVSANGQLIITKQPGQNGFIIPTTVRTQLLYEIQGRYYFNPDVIADFENTRMVQVGPDRVEVSGVKGFPPPETLKVAILGHGGYQAEMGVWAVGLEIEEKARSLEAHLRDRPVDTQVEQDRTLYVQCIGRSDQDPQSEDAATAFIRIFIQSQHEEDVVKCAVHYYEKWQHLRCQIILTSSAASFLETPPMCLYSASKAGIVGLMRSMRTDLAKKNISINVVARWFTITPMVTKGFIDLWGTLPANTPEGVANGLLLPVVRKILTGSSFSLQGIT